MLAFLRLLFPVPLLLVGASGATDPLLAGVSLALALLPFVLPKIALGRAPGRIFIGGGLTLFVLGAVIGVGVSYNPVESLPLFFTILGSVSLLFVVANATVSSRTIAEAGALVGVLFALYFATQYAHFNYPLESGFPPRVGRWVGNLFPQWAIFVPHPNAAATFLEGAFFLILGLIFTADRHRRIFWGMALVPVGYGLFITFSRGAWLGIALALAMWLVFRLPKRWQPPVVAVMGMGIGALGGIIGLSLLTRSVRLSPLVGRLVNGIGGRYELYRNSLELLRDYPLTGVGLGDVFAPVYSRYQLLIDVPFLYYAHNLPLAVWLGQGILGVLGLVWLLVQFYRMVWLVERLPARIHHQPLFRAAWLGATASLLHGLLDSAQFSPDRWTMPMLFLLWGLTIVLARRALRRQAHHPPKLLPVRWRWAIVGVVALVLVALSPKIAVLWRVNVGALYQTRAELAPERGALPGVAARARAESAFDAALAAQPENPVANRRLGMMMLDAGDFAAAADFLQTAYRAEPHNQPTLKALGYAYLWTGQSDAAEILLRQVDFRSRLVDELGYYEWWWGTQNRPDLSRAATEMRARLLNP